MVVRLEGTNVEQARKMLDAARAQIPQLITATDLTDAARKVVAAGEIGPPTENITPGPADADETSGLSARITRPRSYKFCQERTMSAISGVSQSMVSVSMAVLKIAQHSQVAEATVEILAQLADQSAALQESEAAPLVRNQARRDRLKIGCPCHPYHPSRGPQPANVYSTAMRTGSAICRLLK